MSATRKKAAVYEIEWEKYIKSGNVGFARRQRHFKLDSQSSYNVQPDSVQIGKWQEYDALTVSIASEDNFRPPLQLFLTAIDKGIFRLVIDDLTPPKHPRHVVKHVLLDDIKFLPLKPDMLHAEENFTELVVQGFQTKVRINFYPFTLQLLTVDANETLISLNDQSRLRFEDFTDSQGSDGIGPETYRGFTDTKPRGPESVGIDVNYPSSTKLHGIPERASRLALPDTICADETIVSEPYRMYNLDVSYYELDCPFGLYGAVPLLFGRNDQRVVATFYHNTSDTYVDLSTSSAGGKQSHWYSESGLLDIFLLPGPTSSHIYDQYLSLTGYPAMQQRFVLGYHQCRYSYDDEKDVRAVNEGFENRNIPYDVMWLDIDHTDDKRYFTWDSSKFPDPPSLRDDLVAKGRKIVTIVDPHIKRDENYRVHALATAENLYVRNPDGTNFVGKCWAGDSSYYDYTSERARQIWSEQFDPKNYVHFTQFNHIWNDMNEPSVFDGPENSIGKDAIHKDGVEHRHVHNLYGHQMVSATYAGMRAAHGGNSRPFLLTRSFFAGSQRYATVWTGDNTADWNHLAYGIRMLLALQISGIGICGADVGGFFGNPDGELTTRWYQAGVFQPFFRGHSNNDTERREPWLFGEPFTTHIAQVIRARYEYLPYWYTLMAASAIGQKAGFPDADLAPPMRPMWWEFSNIDDNVNESQWMVGNALLVAPVLQAGASHHGFYLPPSEIWYDIYDPKCSGRKMSNVGHVDIDVDLGRMVALQRGGTIIPKVENTKRSSVEGAGEKGLTILVALDAARKAKGKIYVDDGQSYAFEKGNFILSEILIANDEMQAEKIGGSNQDFGAKDGAVIGKIVVFGSGRLTSVCLNGKSIKFDYSESNDSVTVDGVELRVDGGWKITIAK